MHTFAVPYLLLVGGLLAVQAAANLQLSGALRSPLGASALQLTVGAGLLLVLAAALGTLGALDALPGVDTWHLFGGLASAVYITAGILVFARLGAVVSVGLFVAGQTLASVLLDGFGWLGVRRDPLDAAAGAGALGVVAGTYLIVRAQTAGSELEAAVRRRAGWAALAVAAGAVLPVQGAVNAQLRADLDAPVAAGAWSFIVAAVAMAAALALALAVTAAPRPDFGALPGVPWWGWLGGLCGAVYVVSSFLLIPEIGVAPTITLTVAGQQAASVLLDRHGLLGLPRRPISAPRLAGVAMLMAGVALVQVA